ncbi:hypothetical protein [Winogradskyella forsetii]|uniref:hypothetical protein n=1 Tax=Winogradskyella forsetii TaxID=2686077 RepID=UPI0015B9D25B|nr:hypothetical protein [Winogradskyella forsetii]
MNPIKTESINVDKVEDVRQVEQEKKQEHVGTIKFKPGHTLYEVNTVEHTIELATFEEQTVAFKDVANKPKANGFGILGFKTDKPKVILSGLPTTTKQLIKKKNCIYISALNRKNLLKKLEKRGVIKIVKAG